MKNDLSRRGFVKRVGMLMGAAGMMGTAGIVGYGCTKPEDVKKLSRMDASGLTLRKRGHKYPWWVKTVDQMTTETDPTLTERPSLITASAEYLALITDEEASDFNQKTKDLAIEGISNNVPGRSLKDYALQNACQGYQMISYGSFDNGRFMQAGLGKQIQNWYPFTPQSLGLPAWQATPEEASKAVYAAAVQLGASQVGFTPLNKDWMNENLTFDPNATTHEIDLSNFPDVVMTYPESYKYCAAFISQGPRDLLVRNQSVLGGAGDRAAYARNEITANGMVRFIKALGYDAVSMYLTNTGSVVPHAIQAGLGELGRMNRMINPIYGGNLRIDVIVTNLPLAMDQPIDFGLQEFCKNCKVCATKCPSGALSLADEPYWIPANSFQAAGKKTYYEDNTKCNNYMTSTGTFCSTCLSVCPWSKMDKTALHDISKVLSSQVPSAGNILKKMDESFGYGLVEVDSPEMEDWWDLDIPEYGIDSYQGMEVRS